MQMMWMFNSLMRMGLIPCKQFLDFEDGEIGGAKIYVRSGSGVNELK